MCFEVIEKLEVEKGGLFVEGIVEFDVFGFGILIKNDEFFEFVWKLVGGWGILEFCFFECVIWLLFMFDFCWFF